MLETTKANNRRKLDILFNKILKGDGIDIGCGPDPLSKVVFPDIKN